MKLLSVSLTVMLLGGVASTAAAADYESNSPLLAANTEASPMSDAQAHGDSAAMGTIPNSDADEDATPEEAAHAAHVDASPHPDAAAHTPGPPAGSKPRASAAHPASPPATASWQSLLPGSIQ